jgi:hypothetical protein
MCKHLEENKERKFGQAAEFLFYVAAVGLARK